MPPPSSDPRAPPKPALTGFQRLFVLALAILLAGSVALRALASTSDAADGSGSSSAPTPFASALVSASASTSSADEPEGLRRLLPYLTEASFFGLIGFALGYASRKLFKAALILVALAFVAVQLLVWSGHVSVDWLGVRSEVNRLLFNLKENETLVAFLTNRVPSVGAMLLGWLFGFKRG